MSRRRIFYSSIVGVLFAAVPILIQGLTDSNAWRIGAGIFMLPGIAVGFLISGGVVHWISWQVFVVVNFVFYSGLTYLILLIREKLLSKRRNQSTEKPISAAGADAGSRS